MSAPLLMNPQSFEFGLSSFTGTSSITPSRSSTFVPAGQWMEPQFVLPSLSSADLHSRTLPLPKSSVPLPCRHWSASNDSSNLLPSIKTLDLTSNNQVTAQRLPSPPQSPSATNLPSLKTFSDLYTTSPQQSPPLSSRSSGSSPPTSPLSSVSRTSTSRSSFSSSPSPPTATLFVEGPSSPVKSKKKRGRIPMDRTGLCCLECKTRETPEWRSGPGGVRTLCNACGLQYAKKMRTEKKRKIAIPVTSS